MMKQREKESHRGKNYELLWNVDMASFRTDVKLCGFTAVTLPIVKE